jgi:hypothetical protein
MKREPASPSVSSDVDRVADDGGVDTGAGVDPAHHHIAGMHADAHREVGHVLVREAPLEPFVEALCDDAQEQAGLERTLGMAGTARRILEHRQDAVAEQLHDPAALLQDRLAGAHEVRVEQVGDLLRGEHLRQRREVADVGEQHGARARFLRGGGAVRRTRPQPRRPWHLCRAGRRFHRRHGVAAGSRRQALVGLQEVAVGHAAPYAAQVGGRERRLACALPGDGTAPPVDKVRRHRDQQRLARHRQDQVIRGAAAARLRDGAGIATRGYHDERHAGRVRVAAQATQQPRALEALAPAAADDQVGFARQRDALGRSGVLRHQHLVSRRLQVQAQEVAQGRGVLEHQELGHGPRRRVTARRGSARRRAPAAPSAACARRRWGSHGRPRRQPARR